MIPILLLVGLIVGRWFAIPVAAVAWAVILGLMGIIDSPADYPPAALFAAVNTAVGVAVHKLIVWPFRRRRARLE